jgi:hypothetical protein
MRIENLFAMGAITIRTAEMVYRAITEEPSATPEEKTRAAATLSAIQRTRETIDEKEQAELDAAVPPG